MDDLGVTLLRPPDLGPSGVKHPSAANEQVTGFGVKESVYPYQANISFILGWCCSYSLHAPSVENCSLVGEILASLP